MTEVAPSGPGEFCPYVGLQPFTQADQAYFFGREKERRIISANLFAAPLTVLYGPSAVGKSSVLQAGVLPALEDEPHTAVVYFARWQGEDYRVRLKAAIWKAITAVRHDARAANGSMPLDAWIAETVHQFRGMLLLILDQFEEYLLYYGEEDPAAFDAELARIVNRDDLGVHVLIGLRDDSLSRLNRFSKRIPNLLGNTLALRRLGPQAARRAITGPIERYRELHAKARPTRLEETLVDRVLSEVQIEKVEASLSGGIAGLRASEDHDLIETAFLQLVLTELWRAASERSGDRVLSVNQLDALGGAKAIVRRHVAREMAKLGDEGREIAAKLFHHLVTPSGAKYALRIEDLVELAGHSRPAVSSVLAQLAEARLLRRLDPPERYEIFHDAFAVALLEWRKGYQQQRTQEEALRAAEAKRRADMAEAARRLRWRIAVTAALVLLLAGIIYVVHERRERTQLQANLAIAQVSQQQSQQATAAAIAAQRQAEAEARAGRDSLAAREFALEERTARLKGDIAAANVFRAQQQAKARSAADAQAEADRYARESKARLQEAQRSQTQIKELVDDANSKGLTVTPMTPEAQKTSEPLSAAPPQTTTVEPQAGRGEKAGTSDAAPPPPTAEVSAKGKQVEAPTSNARPEATQAAVSEPVACQTVRVNDHTAIAASFADQRVFVYLLDQGQQFKPPAIKAPDKAKLLVITRQAYGLELSAGADPKNFLASAPVRIDANKVRQLLEEGFAVQREVENNGSFDATVDGRPYRFTVETHLVRRYANVTVCPG